MKIAIEGCAHGELEKIYDTIETLELQQDIKVDLLICCGDFQSTRNEADLSCMAVPQKYKDMCTFYKYYKGEKTAPVLTIFVGGNHEASNYLQELAYGGWVAPNIYYMGYAGVVNIRGIKIAGLSGIYKPQDFFKGHYERPPYDDGTLRSVYHTRNLEVFRLRQMSQPINIFISHDWPKGIYNHGDIEHLLKMKPFFRDEVYNDKIGSAASEDLLLQLKPDYWFAAHHHCKFAALVPHEEDGVVVKTTRFLALDKCLPKRRFLQVIDIPDDGSDLELSYDLEWLAILHITNHLLSVKRSNTFMPGEGFEGRWMFTPSKEEKDLVYRKFNGNLKIPENFSQTVEAYEPGKPCVNRTPHAQVNPQTRDFCEKLGIDDPMELIIMLSGGNESINKSTDDLQSSLKKDGESFTTFIDSSADLSYSSPFSSPMRMGLKLPKPKVVSDDSFDISTDSGNNSQQSNSELFFEDRTPSNGSAFVSSTPTVKKFKRRNESIYKNDD